LPAKGDVKAVQYEIDFPRVQASDALKKKFPIEREYQWRARDGVPW
jgi:hypothetical protein